MTRALEEQWSERSAGTIERTAELERLHDALLRNADRMIVLEGGPGSGKTTVAAQYVQAFRDAFPAGIEYRNGTRAPDDVPAPTTGGGPGLLVFDGLDEVWIGVDQTLRYLRERSRADPHLRILVTSRPGPQLDGLQRVPLGPMRNDEIAALIEKIAGNRGMPPGAMVDLAQGNPLLAQLIGSMGRDQANWESLITSMRSFGYPGLIDPQGQPIGERSPSRRAFISDVREVNDAIMQMIRGDPDLIYQLSPRRFEEISAELFTRLGYDVELTPPTKDGGKDLIIVNRSDLGTAMTFVECKRYAPDRPVGVEIVRALNGVVEAGRATSGIVLTSSYFTRGAREEQRDLAWRMSLQDYAGFKSLLDRAMTRVRSNSVGATGAAPSLA